MVDTKNPANGDGRVIPAFRSFVDRLARCRRLAFPSPVSRAKCLLEYGSRPSIASRTAALTHTPGAIRRESGEGKARFPLAGFLVSMNGRIGVSTEETRRDL